LAKINYYLLAKKISVMEKKENIFYYFLIWKNKVFCLRTREGSKPRSSG